MAKKKTAQKAVKKTIKKPAKKAVAVASIVPPTQSAKDAADVQRMEGATKLFAPFLKANPFSVVSLIDPPAGGALFITKPWGDDSLALRIQDDSSELQEALNNVYLPERFIAIWHKDTKDFEIIWTAFPLNPLWREIPGRAFKFRYGGKEYDCSFGGSSKRLLAIARTFRALTSSNTFFRNLESYRNHLAMLKKHAAGEGPEPATDPKSFWIKNLEWDEDHVLALINNLNFYLQYFDNLSPTILVHTPAEASSMQPQTRYPAGKFPGIIDGRPIDDILLQLWSASKKVDEATRFLYCFRIIEYASYSYLDGKARLEIRRILSAADALDNVAAVTEQVVESLQKAKLDDWPKFEALLEDTVKPSLLWREISQNLGAFSKVTKFEGGFDLKPFIPESHTEDAYCVKGIENFHKAIREIRNALSHGKDTKTAGVILPTVRNFELLRPWVSLISIAASEVMLFKNIV